MYWAQNIRLRMSSAFGGTAMPRASSTDRTEASACTVVQTPQTRSVKAQASRGSRPLRMISMPRTMVPALQASVMRPSLTSASMRRWPSMRVMGSTTMRVLMVHSLVRLVGFRHGGRRREAGRFARLFPDLVVLADVGEDRVGGGARDGGRADGEADLVGRRLDAEAREAGEPLVEGPVVPEARLGAADAAVAGLDGIADAVVPADHAAGIVGRRPAAAHLVEAEAVARIFVVEGLDEEAGVIVGPAVAGVVHPPRVECLRAAERIQLGDTVEGQQVHHDARHHLGDRRAALDVDDRLAGDHLVDRRGLRRIGLGGLDAAGAGAVAPGDDGLRPGGGLLNDVERRAPADDSSRRRHPPWAPNPRPSAGTRHAIPSSCGAGIPPPGSRPPPAESRCNRGIPCRAECPPRSDATSG